MMLNPSEKKPKIAIAAILLLLMMFPESALAQTVLDESLPAGVELQELLAPTGIELGDANFAQYKDLKRIGHVVCGRVLTSGSEGKFLPFFVVIRGAAPQTPDESLLDSIGVCQMLLGEKVI